MKKLKRILSILLITLLVGVFIFIMRDKFFIDNGSTTPVEETKQENVEKKEDNKTDKEEQPSSEETPTTNIERLKYPKISLPSGEVSVVGTTSKGFTIEEINGVTYIDGYMMVNKTYGLPEDFLPENTKESCEGKTNTCNKCINNTAYEAFLDMQADAAALGLNIYISSGYRPYIFQKIIYNRYKERDGKTSADTYSARAGYSEHQSSLAFDLNSINDSFASTNEGVWVNSNAYLYGFVIRFPKGKQDITGYKYESWHLRYVGEELAKKLYNDGDWLSLEEYFGVESKYVY